MNPIFVVAKKEMKQIAKNRSQIFSIIIFMGIFGGMTSLGAIMSVLNGDAENIVPTLDSLMMYLVLVLGVFSGYFLSSQAFLGEKTGGTIETLLCSPLPLRNIWLGKVIGVMVPSYAIALVIAAVIIALSNMAADFLVLPSPIMIVFVLVVVPVYIACIIGMLGFIQLLLGMRENQIVNIALIIVFIAAISIFDGLVTEGLVVMSALVVGGMLMAGILLLTLIGYMTRILNKEKIVTTLP